MPLPEVTASVTDTYRVRPASTVTCSEKGSHLTGRTEANSGEGDIGMKFDALLTVVGGSKTAHNCTSQGALVVPKGKTNSLTFVVASGTEYDQKKGSAADNYSFRGVDPLPAVQKTAAEAQKKCYSDLLKHHAKDHSALFNLFRLDLPDPQNSAGTDTAQLLQDYTRAKGNPFVEGLVIDYGKYMYIASSRPGSLPPNLQGKWSPEVKPAWSADYHIDVNVQMSVKLRLDIPEEHCADFATI